MIAANDIALRTAGWPVAPVQPPAIAAPAGPALNPHRAVASGWDGILRGTLFLAILLSCIALIEPSPHDFLMVVLLGIALFARVPFKRLPASCSCGSCVKTSTALPDTSMFL